MLLYITNPFLLFLLRSGPHSSTVVGRRLWFSPVVHLSHGTEIFFQSWTPVDVVLSTCMLGWGWELENDFRFLRYVYPETARRLTSPLSCGSVTKTGG